MSLYPSTAPSGYSRGAGALPVLRDEWGTLQEGTRVPMSYASGRIWVDISAEGMTTAPGAQAPTYTQVDATGVYANAFTGSGVQNDSISGSFEVPHGYAEGTDIQVHISTAPSTAPVGAAAAVWELKWVWINNDATISNSTTTTITHDLTGAAANTLQDVALVTASGTGKRFGSHFLFTLTRLQTNAADTYTQPVFLFALGAHLQLDAHGSRSASAKWT